MRLKSQGLRPIGSYARLEAYDGHLVMEHGPGALDEVGHLGLQMEKNEKKKRAQLIPNLR